VAPRRATHRFVPMRRAGWFRSLAAVVELWLVAVLLGHGTIYACPEHDGAPPAIHARCMEGLFDVTQPVTTLSRSSVPSSMRLGK